MNTEKTINTIDATELVSAQTSEEETVQETTAVVEATTVDHSIGFTPDGLDWSLPIMGKGMLGIFIVTTIIVTVTVVLNKATTRTKKNQGKYNPEK